MRVCVSVWVDACVEGRQRVVVDGESSSKGGRDVRVGMVTTRY